MNPDRDQATPATQLTLPLPYTGDCPVVLPPDRRDVTDPEGCQSGPTGPDIRWPLGQSPGEAIRS